ncbi:TIGR02680 family protein [Nakamurella sp. PAMC28650]|uniref:TIGR02680 family protein n=1 Tax=Nakamurella sp. PAMC28650 TaxID=2762325 RepID=UPI00164D7AF5|nr:TIGR02680 family protein [Nakamurella sp. PAMC28650]QNK83266.1 TIGR02680 family protein [Nakamurella sp. PAMC28650]
MTAFALPAVGLPEQLPVRREGRWRLHRAGIVNVWQYLDNEFDISGGRMILRGTNGSGKSRALEMLLPFLLDGDRRKMDATGSGKVSLDELMKAGIGDQTNRSGYLWAEFARPGGYLTVGVLLRYSRSAHRTQPWFFTTPFRVGEELTLLSRSRDVLTLDELKQLIGAERGTDSAEVHRERVRTELFGLRGDSGRDRFAGLLQLLHTLRSPDVGNRIDEGKLPQILSDALPPLRENTLTRAGDQLDGLTETRAGQQRLENSLVRVQHFLQVYRRYAAGMLVETATATAGSADDYLSGQKAARRTLRTLEQLMQEAVEKQAAHEDLRDQVGELNSAIEGIKGREIFKTADDLAQRDHAVAALAVAADAKLNSADVQRRNHGRAVEAADGRLREVQHSVDGASSALAKAHSALRAARLPDSGLVEAIRGIELPDEPGQAVVRTEREGPPVSLARPLPRRFETSPLDLEAPRSAATASAEAARRRAEVAGRRMTEAKRLVDQGAQVQRAEDEAAQALELAERDAFEAAEAVLNRDAGAAELASDWRAWIIGPGTVELLGPLDWSVTVLAPLLDDLNALLDESLIDLEQLDQLAAEQAAPARDAMAATRHDLLAQDAADMLQRNVLRDEQRQLLAAQDPAPAEPPWLLPGRSGVPFWRAVDFVDDVPEQARAGIEGALLAAGVLTATITADGSVRAASGEILLSVNGSAAARPLSRSLRPDEAAGIPPALVNGLLAIIGLDEGAAVTSVGTDGSWRNGPLRGRHQVADARHIGAQARARRRAARLAEIDSELAALEAAAELRRTALEVVRAREDALNRHLRTAPSGRQLSILRSGCRIAGTRATNSRTRGDEANRRAQELRSRWSAELVTHQQACAHFDLPADEDALRRATSDAADADRHCRALADALRDLADRIAKHGASLRVEREARQERDQSERAATESWQSWMHAATELSAQHEVLDLDVAQAAAELKRSTETLAEVNRAEQRAGREIAALQGRLGEARAARAQADTQVEVLRALMISAAELLSRRLLVPGLLSAATAETVDPIERPEQPEAVKKVTDLLLAVVKKPAQPVGENAVLNAFQAFDRDVSGQLDTARSMEEGVHVVQVAGVGDVHTLAGAASELNRRVEVGRAALTDREREVFTTFVIGGVAEELRRQVNQAKVLIAVMNDSLKSIRTTNGIGVRLGWGLGDQHSSLARVLKLVATSGAVRSSADNDELTDLIRERVEEFYAADPSSGYAGHLAAALDYRRWHDVEVVILGPTPGQERRISKRAKLSQGETRFVSYVTLFAAADGYLSGLPESEHALRLILLDDAFAKVDDPTIAELMGLLVHLDLDFVMTAHSLWGCFPQVPKLDIYEVRRFDNSSAVTTHTHWDGHRRHVRLTT